MEMNHQEILEKQYNHNMNWIREIVTLLESLDPIESNIEKKLEIHKKYVETLQTTLKESMDSYHSICKNLI